MININPNSAKNQRNKNIRIVVHVFMAFIFALIFNLTISEVLALVGFSMDTKIAEVGLGWGLVYLFSIVLLGLLIYAPIWILTGYIFKAAKV